MKLFLALLGLSLALTVSAQRAGNGRIRPRHRQSGNEFRLTDFNPYDVANKTYYTLDNSTSVPSNCSEESEYAHLCLTGGRYHPTDYSFYTKYPQLPVLYAYGYNGTELTYTDVLVDDSGTVYANGSRYNSDNDNYRIGSGYESRTTEYGRNENWYDGHNSFERVQSKYLYQSERSNATSEEYSPPKYREAPYKVRKYPYGNREGYPRRRVNYDNEMESSYPNRRRVGYGNSGGYPRRRVNYDNEMESSYPSRRRVGYGNSEGYGRTRYNRITPTAAINDETTTDSQQVNRRRNGQRGASKSETDLNTEATKSTTRKSADPRKPADESSNVKRRRNGQRRASKSETGLIKKATRSTSTKPVDPNKPVYASLTSNRKRNGSPKASKSETGLNTEAEAESSNGKRRRKSSRKASKSETDLNTEEAADSSNDKRRRKSSRRDTTSRSNKKSRRLR